jgi:hypothetical protein
MGIKFTAEQHVTVDTDTIGDRKYRWPSQSPAVCPLFHHTEAPSQVPGMSHSCQRRTLQTGQRLLLAAPAALLPFGQAEDGEAGEPVDAKQRVALQLMDRR